MGIMLKRMAAGWKAMTPMEKAKIVLRLICSFGGGTIGGDIASRAAKDSTTFDKFCLVVTGVGLGGYIGEKSSEHLEKTLDACVELNNMRKQFQEEAATAEEDNANG